MNSYCENEIFHQLYGTFPTNICTLPNALEQKNPESVITGNVSSETGTLPNALEQKKPENVQEQEDLEKVQQIRNLINVGEQTNAADVHVVRPIQLNWMSLNSWTFSNITKYNILGQIGNGSYGKVFKGYSDVGTVAVKKVVPKCENYQVIIKSFIREMNSLTTLNHPNVVKFIEACMTMANDPTEVHNPSYFIVMEYCEYDLVNVISNMNLMLSPGEIRGMCYQLLSGVQAMHSSNILHRDLKPANILLNNMGILKIADFGLSKKFTYPIKPGTPWVITLWYRPPELLLGANIYSTPIDLWSVGCIMAEFWLRKVAMPGKSEMHQLQLISQFCGSITPFDWPGVEKLPVFMEMRNKVFLPHNRPRVIINNVYHFNKDRCACDLLDKLLKLNPARRINADTALKHAYFSENCTPANLISVVSKLSDRWCTRHVTPISAPMPKVAVKKTGIQQGFSDRIY